MGELLGKHQLGKTILQRRKQGLLGSNQLWCRTEDVRTIPGEDVNTDRWRTETPPGIGNMGGQSQSKAEKQASNQQANEMERAMKTDYKHES